MLKSMQQYCPGCQRRRRRGT